jgi:hypothetical protein
MLPRLFCCFRLGFFFMMFGNSGIKWSSSFLYIFSAIQVLHEERSVVRKVTVLFTLSKKKSVYVHVHAPYSNVFQHTAISLYRWETWCSTTSCKVHLCLHVPIFISPINRIAHLYSFLWHWKGCIILKFNLKMGGLYSSTLLTLLFGGLHVKLCGFWVPIQKSLRDQKPVIALTLIKLVACRSFQMQTDI